MPGAPLVRPAPFIELTRYELGFSVTLADPPGTRMDTAGGRGELGIDFGGRFGVVDSS